MAWSDMEASHLLIGQQQSGFRVAHCATNTMVEVSPSAGAAKKRSRRAFERFAIMRPLEPVVTKFSKRCDPKVESVAVASKDEGTSIVHIDVKADNLVQTPSAPKATASFILFATLSWSLAVLFVSKQSHWTSVDGEALLQPMRVIIIGHFVTVAMTLPGASRCVESMMGGQENLRELVFILYSLEPLGIVLMGLGAAHRNFAMQVLATIIMTQSGMLHLIQRRTTGVKDTGHWSKAALATACMSHHIASHLYFANMQTVVFMTVWRTISISGHSFQYLEGRMKLPRWAMDILGWTRVATCVCLFQPVALYATAGGMFGWWQDDDSTWSMLSKGLQANALGIAAYTSIRCWSMVRQYKNREKYGIKRCNLANALNVYGRQRPILEIEICSLVVLTVLLWARAATSL